MLASFSPYEEINAYGFQFSVHKNQTKDCTFGVLVNSPVDFRVHFEGSSYEPFVKVTWPVR